MAGLLLPYQATELVGALKDAVKIPIDLHTHYTSGVASMTYMKAVEAVSYTHLDVYKRQAFPEKPHSFCCHAKKNEVKFLTKTRYPIEIF